MRDRRPLDRIGAEERLPAWRRSEFLRRPRQGQADREVFLGRSVAGRSVLAALCFRAFQPWIDVVFHGVAQGKEPEIGKGRAGAAAASVVETREVHLHDPALIADAAHLQDHVDRGLEGIG